MKRYFLASAVALATSTFAAAQVPYQPTAPAPTLVAPTPVYPNQAQPIYPAPAQPIAPIPGQPYGAAPGQMTGLAPGQMLPPFPNQPPLVYPKEYFEKVAHAVNGHPGVPAYPGMAPAAPPSPKTGWHPLLRFKKHKSTSAGCTSCGEGPPSAPAAAEPEMANGDNTSPFRKTKYAPLPPVAQGGTLVFPHHPFVRSPRDWFQQD